MGRRTLLLIASILVAALGTTLIWLYVQGADTRAQADTALVKVLFAGKAADAGATINDVTPVQQDVPATLAASALQDPAVVSGQQLINGVTPGQILMRSMFSPQSQSGIGDKNAYVSITVSDPHRVPALLKAGDRVAIYALAKGSKDGLRLVMPVAKVARLGNVSQAGPNGAVVPVTIVGFETSPEDAAQLIDIETYGDPVLALLGKDAQGADLR